MQHVVLAARLIALLGRQIILSMHKEKVVKENSLSAKVDYF